MLLCAAQGWCGPRAGGAPLNNNYPSNINNPMIQDKLTQLIQKINNLRDELKTIQKDIKQMEKITEEPYLELEKALKDLKTQIKDYKDNFLRELAEDSFYNQLREEKLKKEEDFAEANADLFELLDELPPKIHEFKVNAPDMGPVNIHIQPQMLIYLNGKEEKRRVN
jgi:chromosome segregation ATPase